MPVEPLRVVGECQCMEHQAGARYREIIKEMQEQVRIANEVIASLRQDLYYLSEVEYEPEDDRPDPGDRPVPSADDLDSEQDSEV